MASSESPIRPTIETIRADFAFSNPTLPGTPAQLDQYLGCHVQERAFDLVSSLQGYQPNPIAAADFLNSYDPTLLLDLFSPAAAEIPARFLAEVTRSVQNHSILMGGDFLSLVDPFLGKIREGVQRVAITPLVEQFFNANPGHNSLEEQIVSAECIRRIHNPGLGGGDEVPDTIINAVMHRIAPRANTPPAVGEFLTEIAERYEGQGEKPRNLSIALIAATASPEFGDKAEALLSQHHDINEPWFQYKIACARTKRAIFSQKDGIPQPIDVSPIVASLSRVEGWIYSLHPHSDSIAGDLVSALSQMGQYDRRNEVIAPLRRAYFRAALHRIPEKYQKEIIHIFGAIDLPSLVDKLSVISSQLNHNYTDLNDPIALALQRFTFPSYAGWDRPLRTMMEDISRKGLYGDFPPGVITRLTLYDPHQSVESTLNELARFLPGYIDPQITNAQDWGYKKLRDEVGEIIEDMGIRDKVGRMEAEFNAQEHSNQEREDFYSQRIVFLYEYIVHGLEIIDRSIRLHSQQPLTE